MCFASLIYINVRFLNVYSFLIKTIYEYNILLNEYNKNPCKENKLYLLYNCPVGLQLTARMTTNYRQFKTIYKQRKNHTLPEWREFCKWIETLPYAELITGGTENE